MGAYAFVTHYWVRLSKAIKLVHRLNSVFYDFYIKGPDNADGMQIMIMIMAVPLHRRSTDMILLDHKLILSAVSC